MASTTSTLEHDAARTEVSPLPVDLDHDHTPTSYDRDGQPVVDPFDDDLAYSDR